MQLTTVLLPLILTHSASKGIEPKASPFSTNVLSPYRIMHVELAGGLQIPVNTGDLSKLLRNKTRGKKTEGYTTCKRRKTIRNKISTRGQESMQITAILLCL